MDKRTVVLSITIIVAAVALVLFLKPPAEIQANKFGPYERIQAIRFIPNWFPEAEFAGYYYAKHYCLYDSLGIDVEILTYTPSYDIASSLSVGAVDIGVLSTNEFIRSCKEEMGLVALGALFQYEPSVFITKEGSGINCPADFKGKRLVCKNSSWKKTIEQVVGTAGLHLDDIKLIDGVDEIDQFIDGKVDIWTGYAFNEPVELELSGINAKIIYAYDYGISDYQGIISVRKTLVDEKPKVVEAFLRASLEGWERSIRDPESAIKAIQTFNPGVSLSFERRSMSKIIPFIHTGELPMGLIDRERWENNLRDNGVTGDNLAPQFIEKMYLNVES